MMGVYYTHRVRVISTVKSIIHTETYIYNSTYKEVMIYNMYIIVVTFRLLAIVGGVDVGFGEVERGHNESLNYTSRVLYIMRIIIIYCTDNL
jgi:hypothetical protein